MKAKKKRKRKKKKKKRKKGRKVTFLKPKTPHVTRAEKRLRKALRHEYIPHESQVLIKGKIGKQHLVDILLLDKPIIIEVDGYIHDLPDQQRKDQINTKDLQDMGYTVLRFRDQEIWHNLKKCIAIIRKTLKETNMPHCTKCGQTKNMSFYKGRWLCSNCRVEEETKRTQT